MYVCICNAITSRQLDAAIEGGAATLEQLQMDLGVAMGCGCCAEGVQQHLADALAARQAAPVPVAVAGLPTAGVTDPGAFTLTGRQSAAGVDGCSL